jgi:hypothetical protein
MTSRPWHIVRWFGFLAIGLTIAIGSGMRFRAKNRPAEGLLAEREEPDDSHLAQAPRVWMAPEPGAAEFNDWNVPPALPATEEASAIAIIDPPDTTLDPNSPQAAEEIDAIVRAMAPYDVDFDSVQVLAVEDRGRLRFVFSCDVPTSDGAASFVGEGPDPPSAARHALSRIRSWAAAPGETTLR